MRHTSRVAVLATFLALPAGAQVTTVDDGSFTIQQAGRTVGREEFAIRATPGGGGRQFVATATVTMSERRLSPALNADSTGAPVKYQVETRTGGDGREFLSGQIGRGRFSARVQSARGESAREYVVADGALIIDDDVFHQYFFLGRRESTAPPTAPITVPVIVPRRNVQIAMRVESRGREQLTIGGQTLASEHLRLVEPGGATRELWIDDRGRVLRVEVPGRELVAVRDEPPR